MRRASGNGGRLGAVALAMACVASAATPAAAFWPFTQTVPVTVDSMMAPGRLAERFDTWKRREPQTSPADAANTPASVTPAPNMPPGSTAPPGTGPEGITVSPPPPIAQVGEVPSAAATDSIPPVSNEPPGEATADPDSAVSTAPWDTLGSTFAPGDTIAVTTDPDSLTPGAIPAAAAGAMVAKGFAPELKSTLNSTNDFVKLTTDLTSSFMDPNGIRLNTGLGYGEDISLTQRTNMQASNFFNSLNVPLGNRALNFVLSTNNRRSEQTSRTVSNALTSTKVVDRGADASLQAGQRLDRIPILNRLGEGVRGWRANGFVSYRANQNAQNTLATQGTGSGERKHAGNGTSYGTGASYDRFRWVSLRARVGTTQLDNLDRSPTLQNGEQTSTSEGDTATVDMTIPTLWRATNIVLGFRTSNGNDSYTDLARNESGSQSGAIGNYVLENKRTFNRTFNLGMRFKPWHRVDAGLTVATGRDSTSYAVRPNSFLDSRRKSFKLDSKWSLWRGTSLVVNYESSIIEVSQDENGVPNPNTRKDEERKLYVETQKNFTKTLSLKLSMSTQLNQGNFAYVGLSGRQDRDDLRWQIGGDFAGAIGEKVTATVSTYVRAYDQIFIDKRTSANSRNEIEYVVRHGYNWKMTDRISLGQNFGLSSKVLEVVFRPQDNTLNRNHFMNTHMAAQLTPRLSLTANYDYLLQDNGGYEDQLFAATARTKKDGIGLGVRYDVIRGGKLVFVSRQESTRQRSTLFNDQPATITERGNLALGIESKLQVRDLKLDCRFQRNQNFNVALNRAVYYNVDATVQYAF